MMGAFSELDRNQRIERIEQAVLLGERPRLAGKNARLGDHGKTVRLPLVRITIGGISGYGWSNITREAAAELIGAPAGEVFDEEDWIRERFLGVQFPLLDWLGQAQRKPVYELLTGRKAEQPLTVPCYDTTLYFDDLHLTSDADAVRLLQAEAMEGYAAGFRNFKIKVGRGAMHMELMEGTNRDIAIVNGIREAVGSECEIFIDANNGYNLNLTKHVLKETAHSRLLWIEEAFHEDEMLYRRLKEWMGEQGLETMITDGEGLASPRLVEWAEQGLIDAVQYDLRAYGLVQWLKLGARLDRSGIKSAPHNYSGFFGNYASCHIAPAIEGFLFAEWDEARIPGIETPGYELRGGRMAVPDAPGFGLQVDEAYFAGEVRDNGWSV